MIFDRLGIGELIVIFLIVLLIFGAKRLPALASSLAEAIKEFHKALKSKGSNEKSKKIKTKKL